MTDSLTKKLTAFHADLPLFCHRLVVGRDLFDGFASVEGGALDLSIG